MRQDYLISSTFTQHQDGGSTYFLPTWEYGFCVSILLAFATSCLSTRLIHPSLGLGWLPKNSLLRPILMVFIAASCWKANRSPLLRYVPGAVGNDYIIGTILGLSYQLCLAKCTPPPGKRGLRKFLWGLNRSISPRWDTVHIPPFSEKDKSYVPSRGKLILSRLWEFAWLSALIQFSVKSQPISIPQYIYSGEQSWNPFQLLARREEFLLRLHLGFLCIFIPAAALWAAHSLLTCIWLLCGDSPTSWPPLFGPIRTAYTMRRFYA